MNQSLRRTFALKTFGMYSNLLLEHDCNIFHEMINEKKSFKECLSDHYNGPIIGDGKDGHIQERMHHRMQYHVWKNHPWYEIKDEQDHLNESGQFKDTKEVLEDIQETLSGVISDISCHATLDNSDRDTFLPNRVSWISSNTSFVSLKYPDSFR